MSSKQEGLYWFHLIAFDRTCEKDRFRAVTLVVQWEWLIQELHTISNMKYR